MPTVGRMDDVLDMFSEGILADAAELAILKATRRSNLDAGDRGALGGLRDLLDTLLRTDGSLSDAPELGQMVGGRDRSADLLGIASQSQVTEAQFGELRAWLDRCRQAADQLLVMADGDQLPDAVDDLRVFVRAYGHLQQERMRNARHAQTAGGTDSWSLSRRRSSSSTA